MIAVQNSNLNGSWFVVILTVSTLTFQTLLDPCSCIYAIQATFLAHNFPEIEVLSSTITAVGATGRFGYCWKLYYVCSFG